MCSFSPRDQNQGKIRRGKSESSRRFVQGTKLSSTLCKSHPFSFLYKKRTHMEGAHCTGPQIALQTGDGASITNGCPFHSTCTVHHHRRGESSAVPDMHRVVQQAIIGTTVLPLVRLSVPTVLQKGGSSLGRFCALLTRTARCGRAHARTRRR